MIESLKLARVRALSFLVDWLAWAYLAYGSFSLHYLYTSPTLIWRPEEKFVLPPLDVTGWLLAAIILAEVALLCRAFGLSLGLRAFGLTLMRDPDLGREPSPVGQDDRVRFSQRALYFLASQLSLLSLGLTTWLNPRRPWHERLCGVRVGRWEKLGPRRRRWYLTNFGIITLCMVALTLALGWRVVGIRFDIMVRDIGKTARMWQGLTNPDMRYLVEVDPRVGDSLLGSLVESLLMALIATVVGTVIAFPLSFFGARNIAGRGFIGVVVYGITRGLFNVFRSIESIFWAAIFAIWVNFGPFAGSMALLIHTIAALGKLYSEQVEHIDPGPVEAATAAGGSKLQVIKQAVIPQIIPPFLAFTLYRWDINLRMTTVVALVGGGGIGTLFFYYREMFLWQYVGSVVVCFALVIWILDFVSGWVREKIG